MKVTVLHKKNLIANEWDGGKTYEYLIYPTTAEYSKRNFLFRVSSASIEKVPSHFTRFQYYQRFLVMLDNSLELIRNGKQERYEKHDVFSFDSNDEIISSSLGNDFNLMIQSTKCCAKVEIRTHKITNRFDFLVLVALEKQFILINNITHQLEINDVVCIENKSNSTCTIDSNEKIIICEINLLV